MHKSRLKTGLLALAAIVAAAAAALIYRSRTRPAPVEPAPAAPARQPARTAEEAQRLARAAVGERMADTNYLAQLKGIDERRRALAGEGAALNDEIEAWQRQLAAEQPEVAAALEQIKALRQRQASGDGMADEPLARQIADLQVRMAQHPQGKALLARQQDLQTRSEALTREAQALIAARMKQQAAPAAPGGGE